MKNKLLLGIILLCVGAFGLGALSGSLAEQVRVELLTRSSRELVNRDLLVDLSPPAGRYFQGRADGYFSAARLEIEAAHSAEYLQGVADGFAQSALLVRHAEIHGTIDYRP